jgi:hypothetical protein
MNILSRQLGLAFLISLTPWTFALSEVTGNALSLTDQIAIAKSHVAIRAAEL